MWEHSPANLCHKEEHSTCTSFSPSTCEQSACWDQRDAIRLLCAESVHAGMQFGCCVQRQCLLGCNSIVMCRVSTCWDAIRLLCAESGHAGMQFGCCGQSDLVVLHDVMRMCQSYQEYFLVMCAILTYMYYTI